MKIDVSGIIAAKLAQMETDGTIQKKIEETLEKTVTEAITSELSSYTFRRTISDQVKESVGYVAAAAGFGAYNGFMVEKIKVILHELYNEDIKAKLQTALEGVLLQKHETIKLSEIFEKYRKWVWECTDESDKYERQNYTARLDIRKSGSFTHYKIQFADQPDEVDIEIRFCTYGTSMEETISSLVINGHDLRNSLKIGYLTDFEAFLVNLYYNGTKVKLDVDDVDDSDYFDIDI